MKLTKIKLLLTGGTIASVATKNGILPQQPQGKPLLLKEFEKNHSELKNKVQFDCDLVLNKLSENMELSDWEHILYYLKSNSFCEYDGIIIAHGTDTLAFFANMLSVFEKDLPPVYIVSSDKVLIDSSANGNENFACAVTELMTGKIKQGVFVPYRNCDGKMIIHKGFQITQSGILSNDFYSSESIPPEHKSLKYFNGFKKGVILLNSYVGMDLSVIDLTNVTSLIITSYHGGTTNEKELLKLMERLNKKDDARLSQMQNVSLSLASANYLETENQYASTVKLQKQGVRIIYKKTIETAYAEELCSQCNSDVVSTLPLENL